jgi:hypothetical protein
MVVAAGDEVYLEGWYGMLEKKRKSSILVLYLDCCKGHAHAVVVVFVCSYCGPWKQ